MTDYRFGVNLWEFGSRGALAGLVRRADEYGFDVVMAPDHLGPDEPAPFPTLVAMADASERVRLGTFVLNIGFWQPHLLAREVATTDLLTDGRLELGLGTGYVKAESDAAGIPWQPFAERVKRVEEAVDALDRLRGDRPRPPLMIAGTSEPMLKLAADRADILGITGAGATPGKPGALRLFTAAEFDQRMAYFRACAGERLADIEINLLIQWVTVTDDRLAAAAKLADSFGLETSPEDVLEFPTLLIGTGNQIADRLHDLRARYGITYFTVLQRSFEAFAPIIPLMRQHGISEP